MDVTDWFFSAYWPPRKEAADSCAARLTRFVEALRPIDARFANWSLTARTKKAANVPLPEGAALAEYLRSRCMKWKDMPREPIPDLGFTLAAWTGDVAGGSAGLMLTCGLYSPILVNSCSLRRNGEFPMSRATLARIVESAADAFDAATALAGSQRRVDEHGQLYAARPQIGLVTYVATPPAKLPPLPSSVAVKPTRAGSLLELADDAPAVVHETEETLIRAGVLV